MYKIVNHEQYSPVTFMWEVEAPDVARAAQPGHFIMVRLHEQGERIPLTVADFDREKGTVTIVVQAVGKSTNEMRDNYRTGDTFQDFIGPLGLPSPIEKKSKVCLVGGGLGVAPVYPQLRRYKELGSYTVGIVGFRSKELVFWEDKFKQYCDELWIATDDGSYGEKGLVTDALKKVLDKHPDMEEVVAIGPLVMMRACTDVTREPGVKTMVSLNSIMVDGTGMCGSCRVSVGDEMKFACVDGPDFDGHLVNFDELMLRQKRFEREEQDSLKRYDEHCQMVKQGQIAPE